MLLIWDQINIDIFFIDWEKPKISRGMVDDENSNDAINNNRNRLSFTSEVNVNQSKNNDPNAFDVSCWRKLFICNEWNESQIERNINLPITLFFLLLFLRGFSFEYFATSQPLSNDLSMTSAPLSDIYRFTIAIFFYIIITFAQWLFRFLIYDRFFHNKAADMIDLFGLANISAFILDSQYHGYYIHGKTIHSYADTNLQNINQYIENERVKYKICI